MKRTSAAWSILLLGGLATVAGDPAAAASRRPVVVELFTSQGCSSCPPANLNLIALRRRPDVLALSFGVTYWDRLGWKDVFARPDFTARQETYEPRLRRPGPFTPQMVVNGKVDAVGNSLDEVEALVARTATDAGPDLELSPGSVRVGPGAAAARADVWLVRYDPAVVEVAVKRGENTGRVLPHANVVRDLVRLGTWTGAQAVLPLPSAPPGLRTAVLVQLPKGGPILAAVSD